MQDYQNDIAPGWVETLFGLFAFWTYESAFFVLLRPGAADGGTVGASDPVTRAANLAVLAGLVFFAARRRGMLRYLTRHAWPACLIVLYCLCSALWSIDPMTSARRAVSLATCFGFGFYALIAFGPRGTIRLFGWSLLLAAMASWAALPVFGARVFDNEGVTGGSVLHSFHGVFPQKNELSVEMLMGFCCWAYLGLLAPKTRGMEWTVWPVALLVIVTTMVYSRGTTSLIASALASLAVVRMRWPGWRTGLVIYSGLAAAALVLISVAVVEPDLLFALLGKEPNMTGRIPLWVESAHAVLARPLLGWGYDAFWGADSIEAQYIWQRIGWAAPNAHNGPLELALDFGLVGGLLYLFMVLRIAVRAVRGLRDRGFPEAKWLVLVTIAMLVEFIDEGTVGWPNALAITVGFGSALTSVWRAGLWPVPVRPGRRKAARPRLKPASKSESSLAP